MIKLEGTAIYIYSNEEKLYIRANRKDSDYDAGVAEMEIIGASDKFKPLISTKCIQSVRYFKDTILTGPPSLPYERNTEIYFFREKKLLMFINRL